MAVTELEMKDEVKYLEKTLEVVKNTISDLGQNLYQDEAKVLEFKKYMWDNKHGMDPAEIMVSMTENNFEVEIMMMRGNYLKHLLRSQSNPYFGRIDFNGDKIYIGITYVEKDNDHYVYDWRSPIATMFYDGGVGIASYKAPEGTINGTITRRRQYKIQDEKIVRIFDSEMNVVDDMLQEVLEGGSSDKMKNIVDTIQSEQNEIIRDITHKNLIVEGIAGSGKTSVALHRIAFLLYKIDKLKANDILIFSPNNVFSEYISNVLPELGEDNTKNTTWSDFASSYIDEYSKVESFTSFVERYYKKQNKNNDITKIKLSDNFIEFIEEYTKNIERKAEFIDGLDCSIKDYSKDELNSMLKDRYSKFPLFERIESIAENIAMYNEGGKNKKKYVYKLLNILNTKRDYKTLYKNMYKSDMFINKYNTVDNININDKVLKYEDSLAFIYMKGLLNGFPYNGVMKQVVIDEAQDYTTLQYKILRLIFRNASFTILGDVNQTINPYYKYDTLNILENIFTNNTICLQLNKTYRSSKEIIEYTNKILGLNHVTAIRRSNEIPIIKRIENNLKEQLLNDINNLKTKYKSVAVITKTDEEAEKIHLLLKDDIKIEILNYNSENFNRDLVIVPSYVSKGLEFDSVIVYTDINNKYVDSEKYLYYVACTRCQHELIIYNN